MPLHPKTPSSLASFKSRLVLPFSYQLTEVVLEKRSLNVYTSSSSSCACFLELLICVRCVDDVFWQWFLPARWWGSRSGSKSDIVVEISGASWSRKCCTDHRTSVCGGHSPSQGASTRCSDASAHPPDGARDVVFWCCLLSTISLLSRRHEFDVRSCRGCIMTPGKLFTSLTKQYNLVKAEV